MENIFSESEVLNLINNATFANSASFESLKKELVLLAPTLINRYNRKYFLSADGNYRLTLDSNISFFPAPPTLSVLSGNELFEPYNVLELKYNHAKDVEASGITKHLPFRLTKSSKYVLGVLKLYSLYRK